MTTLTLTAVHGPKSANLTYWKGFMSPLDHLSLSLETLLLCSAQENTKAFIGENKYTIHPTKTKNNFLISFLCCYPVKNT